METDAAEEAQETGNLDDRFVVLAEDEEGFGIVQYTSATQVLVYTARKSQQDRFFKALIPKDAFFDLAREVLGKLDAGELESGTG